MNPECESTLRRETSLRTLSALLYRISSVYHRVYTSIFYRLIFGSIGSRSRIIRPMLLFNTEFANIGIGVTIRDGARIECMRTMDRPDPYLSIGDFTSIEQNVHIICRSRVTIGAHVTITGNCAIVDVHHIYENIVEIEKNIGSLIDPKDRPVEIGDFSFLGMFTVVLPGVRIGRNCIIGAGSIVTHDIPDFCVAVGRPAQVVKRYDSDSKTWVREKS